MRIWRVWGGWCGAITHGEVNSEDETLTAHSAVRGMQVMHRAHSGCAVVAISSSNMLASEGSGCAEWSKLVPWHHTAGGI